MFLDPVAQAMVDAFRAIVSQNVASFTGKLRLVCDRLAELTAPHSRMELMWKPNASRQSKPRNMRKVNTIPLSIN